MTVEIPVGRRSVALVDDDDADWARQFRWFLTTTRAASYARRDGPCGMQYMHLLLMRADRLIDHRNGDGLDNRRENLRACTWVQNCQNQRKRGGPLSSIYKGVSFVRQDSVWRAYINAAGRRHWLGRFGTEAAAAHAYDKAARMHYGEYAALNFARVGERSAVTGTIVERT